MPSLSIAPVLRAFKKARVKSGCLDGLDFLWLEITSRCNLTCAHCYASSGPQLPLTERMQLDDWCRVMRDARTAGCRRLQFIGGEPTLHPEIGRLVEHAARVGFRHCEVFTNATLLRDSLIRTFRECGVIVQFSFYSCDAGVHDQITGQNGSFERTVEGIRQLVRNKIRVAAGVINLPQNASHEKEARRFLRRLGVHAIAADRVRGIGRGEQFVPVRRPTSELCGYCWSGKLCVDSNGEAHPCVFSRFVSLGNVLDEGLVGIVSGEKLKAFRRQQFFGDEGG